MNERKIDAIAHKVADILERRFNERQQEMAEKVARLLWDTPIKTPEDYEKSRLNTKRGSHNG